MRITCMGSDSVILLSFFLLRSVLIAMMYVGMQVTSFGGGVGAGVEEGGWSCRIIILSYSCGLCFC